MKLREYLDKMSYGGVRAFAKQCGLKNDQALHNWASERRGCPHTMCLVLERESAGAVTRVDLRKDWADVWPDLLRDYRPDGTRKE